MLAWIFADEEYTALYHSYFSEFLAAYFDNGYLETMIDQVSTMIAPYVEQDPTKFCTYEEFKKGVSTLKSFCLLRAESISGQLDGTIGSTAAAQDSTTLIDAGDLQIDDMGGMNTGRGNTMENRNPEAAPTMPQPQDNTADKMPPTERHRPYEEGQHLEPMAQKNLLSKENKFLLTISIVVLALGLAFAFRYPRRK